MTALNSSGFNTRLFSLRQKFSAAFLVFAMDAIMSSLIQSLVRFANIVLMRNPVEMIPSVDLNFQVSKGYIPSRRGHNE